MRKICFSLLMIVAINAAAFELLGETHYGEDCYDSGWNCHRVSENEREHLMDLFKEDLAPYLMYFKKEKIQKISTNLDAAIYNEAANLCQKVYLLNPDSTVCNLMHCARQREQWFGDSARFEKEYKKECG